MQRISILTVGTRGDVQPFIALACGLLERGYEVVLGAQPDFESLVKSYGVPFAPIGIEAQKLVHDQPMKEAITSGSVFKYLRANGTPEYREAMLALYRDAKRACEGADLIIYRNELLAALGIAQSQQIPCVEVRLQPFSPTREFPGVFLKEKADYGPLINRISGVMARFAFWHLHRMKVNQFHRQDLKVQPLPFFGPDRFQASANVAVVHPISPQVLPKPMDWPKHLHMSGYWFLPPPKSWEPSAALEAFLAAGPPPIYVGFGSMPNHDPQAAYDLILQALQQTGQRGIISSGWGGITASQRDRDRLFCVEGVPHAWLFPKMQAVIHHGGAGTTAAAMRAGIPSIVIPFFADQPFWGWRVAKLGIGPEPIDLQKLTAERLAHAIQQVVSDRVMQEQAQLLGQKISHEEGVQQAIALIERLYFTPNFSSPTQRFYSPGLPRTPQLLPET